MRAGIISNTHGAVLNEGSNDSDTRIEGNGDVNLLYIDAGTDRVGIGDAAPGEKLDVAGNVNVTGVYKVDDVQVVKEQQSAIAARKWSTGGRPGHGSGSDFGFQHDERQDQ